VLPGVERERGRSEVHRTVAEMDPIAILALGALCSSRASAVERRRGCIHVNTPRRSDAVIRARGAQPEGKPHLAAQRGVARRFMYPKGYTALLAPCAAPSNLRLRARDKNCDRVRTAGFYGVTARSDVQFPPEGTLFLFRKIPIGQPGAERYAVFGERYFIGVRREEKKRGGDKTKRDAGRAH